MAKDPAPSEAVAPKAPQDPTAPAPRRAPAGAAVLREEKTAAIRAAVFAELAAVGFGRMSIEGIARRAGVGKTAVYRRWRSKLHLVLDVVTALAAEGMPVPDTGALRSDVRMLLEVASRALRHPMAAQIIPDLLAEAARSPEIAEALRSALHDSQESMTRTMVSRAVERGELRPDVDVRLALDLITGPLYWRVVVLRGGLPAGYLDELAAAVTSALGARGSG
ncbi:TetR/AcrR family transcriptional regulator [Streptomyces sp. NPDC000151]|uniref:TetR/AcrR family transcriptional regulator n=1 Tax=Streptomyces sp. NPDC000151 TaxID=3154244 RepID=UPI0033165FA9